MELEELLSSDTPPSRAAFQEMSHDQLVRLFWKYRGLLKERERNHAFWGSTNENLRLAYEKLDRQDHELETAYAIIQEDLKVANQIQSALLPRVSARMREELDLAVYHSQVSQVGGDYYDFFDTKSGDYAIGVFDICGHGVSAALAMAFLRSELVQAAANLYSPSDVADEVNSRSIDFLRRVKKYATVNLVLFGQCDIRYVCGGGNGLLIRRGDAYSFARRDTFLGLRQKPFHEHVLPFDGGDLLAMYTDGIVEAHDSNERDYTIRRLNGLIEKHAASPVAEILDTCMDDFHGFCDQTHDDITLLIMRKKVDERL